MKLEKFLKFIKHKFCRHQFTFKQGKDSGNDTNHIVGRDYFLTALHCKRCDYWVVTERIRKYEI